MFELFHSNKRWKLRTSKRSESQQSLTFWKMDEVVNYMSPLALNKDSQALLSLQASSASSKRLFSNLGRSKSLERKSMKSGALEITKIVQCYFEMHFKYIQEPQMALLCSVATSSKRIVQEISY